MTQESYAVFLNRIRAGYLVESRDGFWTFRFTQRYRERTLRPVLGQKFEDDLLRNYGSKKRGRLPAFFAHLVPEGRLRAVLEKSLGLPDSSDAQLLSAVSPDLPGALRLVQANAGSDEDRDEDIDLNAEDDIPSSGSRGPRFSLGGNQLKFSMLRDSDRFTLPSHGAFGSWIVKIALANYEELASNEFAVLEWARAAGFDVPEARILGASELGAVSEWVDPRSVALAVRRYDRAGSVRIHQEDFAQILGIEPLPSGEEKYQGTHDNLIKLASAIIGPLAGEEMLLRTLFVVASGNADAHLKNWSIIYKDGVTPALSPIYDQVATVAWPNMDQSLALKLAGTRDFAAIREGAIVHLATKAGLDASRGVNLVRTRLNDLRATWSHALAAGLSAAHADALRKHWERVPLLRESGSLE